MNDSTGPNRQTKREEESRAAANADVPVTLAESLAGERAGGIPHDRADAFRLLVGRSLDDTYRRAAVLLGNRFEAEDAVHDAAERAWRSWGSLRDPAQFEAWFGRILINVCRDRLRRRRRVAVIEVSSDGLEAPDQRIEQQVERLSDHVRVIDVLATLSADERIAIVLRYDADLTVPEIARLTGAPEGTIKSRLHNALEKLRTRLQPEGEP